MKVFGFISLIAAIAIGVQIAQSSEAAPLPGALNVEVIGTHSKVAKLTQMPRLFKTFTSAETRDETDYHLYAVPGFRVIDAVCMPSNNGNETFNFHGGVDLRPVPYIDSTGNLIVADGVAIFGEYPICAILVTEI